MTETVTIRNAQFEVCDCKLCGVVYAMPKAMRDWDRKVGGYKCCPNGHRWGWNKDESEDDKIRRERDQLKQEQARLLDNLNASERNRQRAEIVAIEAQVSERKAKKTLVSLKKRAAAGVCPCCNRTFSALAQHIAIKHPTFRAEDVAHENIVSIVKGKRA